MSPTQTMPIEITTALMKGSQSKLIKEFIQTDCFKKAFQSYMLRKQKAYKMSSQPAVIQAAWNILSPASKKLYKKVYIQFDTVINKDVRDVSPVDIEKYIKYLDDKGNGNKTINLHIAALSKKYSMLVYGKILESNPVTVLSKAKRGGIYRPETQDSGKNRLDFKYYDVSKVIEKKTATGLIIKFLANSGLRIKELCSLKYSQLTTYTESGHEYIKLKIDKSKRDKTRIVYGIKPQLIDDIKQMFNCKSDYLFHVIRCRKDREDHRGSPLDSGTLYKQIRNYFESNTRERKQKGKEVKKHGLFCRPHLLRKYNIQHLRNKGLRLEQIADHAGHTDIKTTAKHYTDNSIDSNKCVIHE